MFDAMSDHLHWKQSLTRFDADEIGALNIPTSFPILFASNTVDPITPLKSYVSAKSALGMLPANIISP